MKLLKSFILTAVAFTSILYYGCENVSEPIDISSTALPAYVQLEDTTSQVYEGDTLDVVFQLPISVNENVDVTFSISGSAEYGTDWTTDDENVSADGGTVTIEHVDSTSSSDEYELRILLLKDNTQDGAKSLIITLESAVTESGEELMIGQGPKEKVQTISITDFDVKIPVEAGTYEYELGEEGDLGSGSGVIEISELDPPYTENDVDYENSIADIAVGELSSVIPYPFSIAGDNVVIAPSDYTDEGVSADISGTYNPETGAIILEVTLTCCGNEGDEWTLTLIPQ